MSQKMTKKEFFESLPESITGPKDDKAYPLKDIEYCGFSFKKNPDGTIDTDNFRIAIFSALKILFDRGFLTIEPLAVVVVEQTITNIANETYEWVDITSYLDSSDR